MKNLSQKAAVLLLSGSILFAVGCGKDDDAPAPITPIGGGGGTPALVVPTTYTFTDAGGISTVSNNGQAQRLEMLSEMITYLKTGRAIGTVLSAQQLKDMYASSGYTWADANGLGMNAGTKQLKNKTGFAIFDGSADAGVQAIFESYMDAIANITALNQVGSPGVSGIWPDDGEGINISSAEGFQYLQFIEKELFAGVFMNQSTVHYLGTVIDDDNTNLLSGKNHTEMEKHWDEAYGYFTDAADYPANGTDRFWGKYANKREAVLSTATKISAAYRKGRAAIVAKDLTTRDAQVVIIRNEYEKVAAGSAIHYLNETIGFIAQPTSRGHVLSEATAFLKGMKYGYNAISGNGMSSGDIDIALGMIGNDYNAVTLAQLQNAINFIAPKVGITASQAAAL